MKQKNENSKGGRPKKSVTEKRQHRFSFSLCTAERFELMTKVAQAGMSVADFIRESISKVVIKERMTPELAAFRREVCGMKNNINHNAYVANRDGFAAAAQENRALAVRLDNALKKFGL